ncbi:SDR family oxidoreductase [uncultured Alsobacter sp.]|uniref:SDR family oxidoreductase n=1 Tax=uncultured Alsobacter sp. TaxID=1748258 RepID=UPI0025E17164|nr:SDR family oxidoreductase [uncultured Alsobacter sp.]
MPRPLAGQTVVVLGASSGMGRATALAAAAAGATVAVMARRRDALDALAADIQAEGGARPLVLTVDATRTDAVERALAEVAGTTGRIDAVVNSVGTNIPRRSLGELTAESWSGMLADNLTAAFAITRAAVPVMRAAGGGLLVHISSVAARKADKSGIAYQATKAGVVALAHGTTEEERENGIRVTAIMPGMTDTPLLERRPTPPTPEMLRIALKPEDVAAACLYVLCQPARVHIPEIILQPART